MTVGELQKIEQRVDEINLILDLCHKVYDADVIDNLDAELDLIVEKLEIQKQPKTSKIKLRIV